ncbi:PLD nuclease N-terminal domain-containing protein [Pseudomonas shirazensis]|uniref:PLD nuclease N-terminal domain-containing protein n=1 Tax=Pseudomonas shirazensis TaxID=2745494 RepID=UPI003D08C941
MSADLLTYFWIAVAAIILLLDLWAIVSVFRSDKADATKVMWALLLVVLPVIGLAIWGIAGPRGIKRGTGPSSPDHSKG